MLGILLSPGLVQPIHVVVLEILVINENII